VRSTVCRRPVDRQGHNPTEPVGTGETITYTLAFHSNGPPWIVITTSSPPTSPHSGQQQRRHHRHRSPALLRLNVQDWRPPRAASSPSPGWPRWTAMSTQSSSPAPPRPNAATTAPPSRPTCPASCTWTGTPRRERWQVLDSAYTDLRRLHEAKAGDQIWIAAGVYKPTAGGLRSASFQLVSGWSCTAALRAASGGSTTGLRRPRHGPERRHRHGAQPPKCVPRRHRTLGLTGTP